MISFTGKINNNDSLLPREAKNIVRWKNNDSMYQACVVGCTSSTTQNIKKGTIIRTVVINICDSSVGSNNSNTSINRIVTNAIRIDGDESFFIN